MLNICLQEIYRLSEENRKLEETYIKKIRELENASRLTNETIHKQQQELTMCQKSIVTVFKVNLL